MKKAILFIKLMVNRLISEIRKVRFNFKTTKTMAKYVAKKNDDGAIDLYQVTTATGVDFSTVNVLTPFAKTVNVNGLQVNLQNTQANLADLQAQVDAINAINA